jgi:CTP synthase
VIEAVKSAGYFHNRKAEIVWIDTEKIEAKDEEEWERMKAVDGIVVPGGFGNRGIEGKVQVAHYCRTNKKPYLGLCLGSQIMAIEFARNVMGIEKATSEEFDCTEEDAKTFINGKDFHVIHFMEDQRTIRRKGGTMRLGSYPCTIKSGTLAEKIYASTEIEERHRHRYEFNNAFRDQFEGNGFIISGTSPDGELVEIVEIKDHPFMIASQFHPEFLSRPFRPHPLFRDLVSACV